MKYLLSKAGAALFIIYLTAGLLLRSYEIESRPRCWMLCDLYSALFSLPAALPVALILRVVGVKDFLPLSESLRSLFIFLSALMLYLTGAIIERQLSRRRGRRLQG